MAKWKVTYQVEESPRYERETKEQIIEAETLEDVRLVASAKILAPMVQDGSPYIPFIYGSEKIQKVEE